MIQQLSHMMAETAQDRIAQAVNKYFIKFGQQLVTAFALNIIEVRERVTEENAKLELLTVGKQILGILNSMVLFRQYLIH